MIYLFYLFIYLFEKPFEIVYIYYIEIFWKIEVKNIEWDWINDWKIIHLIMSDHDILVYLHLYCIFKSINPVVPRIIPLLVFFTGVQGRNWEDWSAWWFHTWTTGQQSNFWRHPADTWRAHKDSWRIKWNRYNLVRKTSSRGYIFTSCEQFLKNVTLFFASCKMWSTDTTHCNCGLFVQMFKIVSP